VLGVGREGAWGQGRVGDGEGGEGAGGGGQGGAEEGTGPKWDCHPVGGQKGGVGMWMSCGGGFGRTNNQG